MNKMTRDMLNRRMMSDSRDRAMSDRARGDRGMDSRYDRAGRGGDSAMDGRRGVRGTGRYGIGGSRYYGRDRASEDFADYADRDYAKGYDSAYDRASDRGYDRADRGYDGRDYASDYGDYGEDYGDYAMDYADYAMDYGKPKMKLKKKNILEWEQKLRNADGSKGPHYPMQKVKTIAEHIGIRFNNYTEKEFAITMNMLYSDYCEAFKGMIPPDKEDVVFGKMAKAFLEDEDAPEASEKLALYYYCVVCGDEE